MAIALRNDPRASPEGSLAADGLVAPTTTATSDRVSRLAPVRKARRLVILDLSRTVDRIWSRRVNPVPGVLEKSIFDL